MLQNNPAFSVNVHIAVTLYLSYKCDAATTPTPNSLGQ